jgi:mRNA-degrading endonuclease RelE of RelBE toxin-antitoxin system
MNFEVYPTLDFQRAFKALAKRHRSLPADMKEFVKSLKKDPYQGVELSPGIRKIRMAITSKGRGKSGGARVITYTILPDELDGRVYLLDIYDKSDADSVNLDVIKEVVSDIGL